MKKEYPDRIEYLNDNGDYHREDGPAIEWTEGSKCWCINGLKHREDGPAVISSDGDTWWYINGKLHREDGPAGEWIDGYKEWYLNGIDYTEEEYHQEVIKLKLERLKNL
jgi:hypothetical protein